MGFLLKRNWDYCLKIVMDSVVFGRDAGSGGWIALFEIFENLK